jgi:hypothetical protein
MKGTILFYQLIVDADASLHNGARASLWTCGNTETRTTHPQTKPKQGVQGPESLRRVLYEPSVLDICLKLLCFLTPLVVCSDRSK